MGCARVSGWWMIALLGTGCPYAIPGLRADVGGAAAVVSGAFKPAAHVAAGASLASIVKEPGVPFDLGAGYVLFYPSELDTVHGGYLDAAWLRPLGRGFRLSVGPRVELLLQERGKGLHGGVGAAARVAIEALTFTEQSFFDGSGDTSGFGFIAGQTHGNLAIGVSSELGVRRLPGQRFSAYLTVALTFRLPASAGFILFIPFPR